MGFAILRTQKLKSGYAVNRSLKHAFREQVTPNADPKKLSENISLFSDNRQSALERFNAILPEKRRKNAVVAIEYLMTASPEDMKGKTREQQIAYFKDCVEWLKEKHGKENIVNVGIHFDETTPHLYAYVVPIDNRGKLNCRSFLGGSKALSDMQSDFAERVGKKHGLERGIKGSKARHQRVSQFYANINNREQIQEFERNRQMAWKQAIIDIEPRIIGYKDKFYGLKKEPVYENKLHIEERIYKENFQPIADRNYNLQLQNKRLEANLATFRANRRVDTSELKQTQIDAIQEQIELLKQLNRDEKAKMEQEERQKRLQRHSINRGYGGVKI